MNLLLTFYCIDRIVRDFEKREENVRFLNLNSGERLILSELCFLAAVIVRPASAGRTV